MEHMEEKHSESIIKNYVFIFIFNLFLRENQQVYVCLLSFKTIFILKGSELQNGHYKSRKRLRFS
jgi:hypothetical protein